MNPNELSSAMNSGWSFANSIRNISDTTMDSQLSKDEPMTCPQSVGIVASYSYIVMVKAGDMMVREDKK